MSSSRLKLARTLPGSDTLKHRQVSAWLTVAASLALATCTDAPIDPPTGPAAEYVFPDEAPPGPFERAYSMTESRDGSVRVFVREAPKSTDLYEMRRQPDGSWSAPALLDFPRRTSNTSPSFSPFDGRLYFASDRTVPDEPQRTDMNLWSVSLTDEGWGQAELLPGDINTMDNETSITQAPRGELYFVSNHPRGQGAQDIYSARFDDRTGEWKTSFMPEHVNSPRTETHVAVTPDGDYLLFYSYRYPRLGKVDITAIHRHGFSPDDWSEPFNVGPAINTKGLDMGPGFSADGETFFFSRNGRIMTLPTSDVMTELEAHAPAAPTRALLSSGELDEE